MLETLFPLGISQYVIGGLLVGAGISVVFILTGRVAGASTVFTSVWSYIFSASFFQDFKGSRSWRVVLSLGFVLGGFLFYWFVADGESTVTALSPLRLFIGGICVGVGTRMAGGCASGHGICGNATFEKDSLVATVTFLVVGIIVALLTSQLI
jgi:uncharacterized membrane protein YedE/YeeE